MGCRPPDCRTLPLVLPDVPNSRLVVLVPEAEPVVGHLRDRWDANAGDGVAAPVTVGHAGTDRSELLVRRGIQSAQSAVGETQRRDLVHLVVTESEAEHVEVLVLPRVAG